MRLHGSFTPALPNAVRHAGRSAGWQYRGSTFEGVHCPTIDIVAVNVALINQVVKRPLRSTHTGCVRASPMCCLTCLTQGPEQALGLLQGGQQRTLQSPARRGLRLRLRERLTRLGLALRLSRLGLRLRLLEGVAGSVLPVLHRGLNRETEASIT